MRVVLRCFSKRFLIFASLTGGVLSPAVYAAPKPSIGHLPIQAELVKALEAGRIKAGDAILAKVDVAWKSPDCNLSKGSILKGRIVNQTERSKTSKGSEIALLFDSGDCGGHVTKPLPLTITAMIAPDPSQGSDLYEGQQSQPLSEAIGATIGGSTSAGFGSGAFGGSSTGGGLRSLSGAAATAIVEPPRSNVPKAVLPGQVIGMGSLKLSVGSGPEGSSVLSEAKRNVRLEAGSQFVLVPAVKTELSASAAAAAASSTPAVASAAPATIPPVEELADETEICTPPQCSVATVPADVTPALAKATATFSIKEL